jgi:hypothetical protein
MNRKKTIDELRKEAESRYPVYPGQKINPATGKPDCSLTIRFALLAREDWVKKQLNCAGCVEAQMRYDENRSTKSV